MLLAVPMTVSTCSTSSCLVADSTLAIIFVAGSYAGLSYGEVPQNDEKWNLFSKAVLEIMRGGCFLVLPSQRRHLYDWDQ